MGGKRFFILVLLVIFSGFTGGVLSGRFYANDVQATSNRQKEVIAEAFHLVDKNGHHRGSFGFSEDGHPILMFRSMSGESPAYFGLTPTGPIIAFHDNKNRMRMTISLDPEGNPDIFFLDENKKPKMGIAINRNGEPGITLHDNENVARMAFLLPGNKPCIALIEGGKKVDMLLTTRPDGQGGLVMQNKHGQIVLGMYNNAPVLTLKKSDGTESITGFFPTGQPFTGLRENGKTIWIAPQGKQAEMQEIAPSSDWQKITDSLLQPPKF